MVKARNKDPKKKDQKSATSRSGRSASWDAGMGIINEDGMSVQTIATYYSRVTGFLGMALQICILNGLP